MHQENGFTLIELLVAFVIVGILALFAVPAYTNYTTKAKFSEVVLATAPLKTYIATCAISGDCISGNAISIDQVVGQSAGVFVPTQANNSVASIQAFFQSIPPLYGNANSSNAATFAPITFATGAYVMPSTDYPGYYCLSSPSDPAGTCPTAATAAKAVGFGRIVPIATFNAQYALLTAGSGGGSGGTAPYVPCVGGGACSPGSKYVASASSDAGGVITATAVQTSGLNGETFILIPSYSAGRVDWTASGTCKTRAGGALC